MLVEPPPPHTEGICTRSHPSDKISDEINLRKEGLVLAHVLRAVLITKGKTRQQVHVEADHIV